MCHAVVTLSVLSLYKEQSIKGDGTMLNSFEGQLADWKYARGLTLKFLAELSDADLDKKLPRKELNTVRLQLEELVMMQENWQGAIAAKSMDFTAESLADTSKQGLATKFSELDKKLEETLAALDGDEVIDWYGDEKSIYEHFSSMIGHEMMHIGQIIAFCYATGIHIPDEITETMSLDG